MRASVLFLSPRSACAEQDGALADGMRWLKREEEGEESVGVAVEGWMEDDGWAGEGRGEEVQEWNTQRSGPSRTGTIDRLWKAHASSSIETVGRSHPIKTYLKKKGGNRAVPIDELLFSTVGICDSLFWSLCLLESVDKLPPPS